MTGTEGEVQRRREEILLTASVILVDLEPQEVLRFAAADDNSFSFFLSFFFPLLKRNFNNEASDCSGMLDKSCSQDRQLAEAWDTRASKSQTMGL